MAKELTPGQAYLAQRAIVRPLEYAAEIKAFEDSGSIMPEPPKLDVAVLIAEIAKATADRSKATPEEQKFIDSRLADLAYEKRRTEGNPTAADLVRIESERDGYAEKIKAQREWLKKKI